MATLKQAQEIIDRGAVDQLPANKQAQLQELIQRGVLTAQADGTSVAPAALQPPDGLPIEELDGNGQIPTQPVQSQGDVGAFEQTGRNVGGALEVGTTLATGLGAEILGGLGVLAKTGTEALKGNLDVSSEGAGTPESIAARERILDTQGQIREAFTRVPRGETGQQFLQSTGETLQSFIQPVEEFSQDLGDSVLRTTGSPTLATLAQVAPELAIDLLTATTGRLLKIAGKGAARTAEKLKESAKLRKKVAEEQNLLIVGSTSKEQLDVASNALFKEIADSGIGYKKDKLIEMATKIESSIPTKGGTKRTAPMLTGIMRDFRKRLANEDKFGTQDLDNLREEMKAAIKQHAPSGLEAKTILDDFVHNSGPGTLTGPPEAMKTISKKYSAVRNLYSRKKKAERSEEIAALADLRSSRVSPAKTIKAEYEKILKPGPRNKELKFYTPFEKKVMTDIVKGKNVQEGALNFVAGLDPVTGGALAKIWSAIIGGTVATVVGPLGLITVPLLGKFSSKVSQVLLDKNMAFADAVFRAGESGPKVVAAWIKQNPDPKLRNVDELAELLMQPHVKLDKLPKAPIVQAAKKKAVEDRKTIFGTARELAKRNIKPLAGAQATIEALQVPVGQIQLQEER